MRGYFDVVELQFMLLNAYGFMDEPHTNTVDKFVTVLKGEGAGWYQLFLAFVIVAYVIAFIVAVMKIIHGGSERGAREEGKKRLMAVAIAGIGIFAFGFIVEIVRYVGLNVFQI